MAALKIKQQTQDGRSKVWKISKPECTLTFGTSRKAKLVSIDQKSESFQSVFEFRDSHWHYISFDIGQHPADQILTSKTVIQLAQSTLSFDVVEKSDFVLTQLENIKSEGAYRKTLVLVTRNNRVVKTHLLESSHPFKFQNQQITFPQTEEWTKSEIEGFVIKAKLILISDSAQLTKMNAQPMEKESKTAVMVTLGLTALIIFSALLAPKPDAPTTPLQITSTSANTIVKNEFRKKKQNSVPQTKAQQPAANNQAAGAGGGKTAALLKGSVGLRISQLLGKVSATEARTANVLVTTKGIKAGEENSGRALAAIGKVESSGRNWNGESTGKGSGVSTAGLGGGKGTKGLGAGLGQGKTGAGGVGLIEEESEIIGGLDREVIAQYIKTQLGQILYCYERQLSASPELYGKIAVKFTIAGTGQVETQSINDTTLKNHSVENCILNKVSKWKFPEPRGGTKVLVTYPFLFKSTN